MRDVVEFYSVDDERCDVIYLGGGEAKSGVKLFRDRQATPLRVLYVGDWNSPYKNFEFMLRGLRVFNAQCRVDVELHVASCRHASSAVQNQHRQLSGVKTVYHEAVSDEALANLYHECHVFVYPSLWEGFGIPIIEALSWGCAVTCSDIPVFHEVGGDVVSYFDPLDYDSLAEALSVALLSEESKDAVERRVDRAGLFTWEECARNLLRSMEKACRDSSYMSDAPFSGAT